MRVQLRAVLGGSSVAAAPTGNGAKKDGRSGKRSAATRAKMAAAQQARWTKKGSAVATTEAAPVEAEKARKKRVMSPEGRARIAAAQQKRWAATKAKK